MAFYLLFVEGTSLAQNNKINMPTINKYSRMFHEISRDSKYQYKYISALLIHTNKQAIKGNRTLLNFSF